MDEHMKLMQDGMAVMGGMPGIGADMAARHPMMAMRMEMVQSMMDRMAPPPSKR